ncbi:hypothetical protein [Pseudomonas sp. NFACC42-2]|uniref:hypothetical protein n=1 Tax=Pseudomonas sp. NFACC42-2 TaxID=1566193 RepID=UPI0008F20CF4|nr:hypothetical protein [Pseudomonas sp. NFACC42-2]SFS29064.1 hypothetical protein SAMN03159318_05394 [Pseudomonas sp. NFACC42-2]
MLEQNQKIVLTGKEALDALKEIEYILISLHKMGSFYAEKPGALEEYRKATTDFIDDCAVTQRLSKVRTIISQHFDDSLGDDELDDIERHFSDLKFWKPDQPLNKKTPETEVLEVSKGTIQQVTCKRNELLVVFTNQQGELLLITFHNPVAFKGISAIGTETDGLFKEGDNTLLEDEKCITPLQNTETYCFKATTSREIIFIVTSEGYSVEKI